MAQVVKSLFLNRIGQRIFDWLIAPGLSHRKYIKRVALVSLPTLSLCWMIAPLHLSTHTLLPFIGLCILALVTSLAPVRISSSGINLCPVLPIIMAMLYLYGPVAAVLIDVVTVLIQVGLTMRERLWHPSVRWSFLQAGSQQVVATGISSLIYQAGIRWHAYIAHSLLASLALSAAAVVAFYINVFISTTISSKAYKVRWDRVWYENHKWMLPSVVLLSPLGFIMGALTEQSVVFGVAFMIMPIVAAQRGFTLHEKRLGVYRFGVDMLGRLMQEAHPYTHGHLHRVSAWAKRIGEAVGLSPESMALIGDAAILHDIGKIAIDDHILNKPGRLTDDEWAAIKTHPVVGGQVAAKIRYLDKVSVWIRHHHERMDGAGYPDRLAGEEIPLESRIISVVDAFDAMVGGPSKDDRRTYREPMSFEAACAELLRCAGSQFDEYVVMSFLRILDEEKLNVPTLPGDGDAELTLVTSEAPLPREQTTDRRSAAVGENVSLQAKREAKHSFSQPSSRAV